MVQLNTAVIAMAVCVAITNAAPTPGPKIPSKRIGLPAFGSKTIKDSALYSVMEPFGLGSRSIPSDLVQLDERELPFFVSRNDRRDSSDVIHEQRGLYEVRL